MTSLSDLILSRTPIISVPSKMAFYTPTGKLKEVSTLTKGGAISTRNKEKVIQFIGNNDNIFRINEQGHNEKNKPEKKEQEAMGREDINIKKEEPKKIKLKIKKDETYKKEQEAMGAEDVDIKGSTMREQKEEKGMGGEDVDIGNKELKKIDFDKLPPIKKKREKELNKLKVDELKNILPNEKEYKKMKKDDLIKAILKKEGIRAGIDEPPENPKKRALYFNLERLYNYYDPEETGITSRYYNPYKNYKEVQQYKKAQEDLLKRTKKDFEEFKNKYENSTYEKKQDMKYTYGRFLDTIHNIPIRINELISNAKKRIKDYEDLLKIDFSPLLE